MKNVYLIGYMGSGKSTAGKQLARILDYTFLDIDRHFEETFRITVMDFFQKYDEQAFRILERKLLQDTFQLNNYVISTGGGTACFQDNIKLINQNGISVYISMHPDSLFTRLKNAKRPRPRIILLNDEQLKSQIDKDMLQREQIYQLAHVKVKGENLDVMALARLIAPKLGISLATD
ncbi:MAG TPA: shikimate kinase [Bacteroidales bacterium]|nr:shikimate kinase [Bacteroidales bacterium]HPR59095.1 shikimate kinase [Bacteroidales bacterium]HRW97269.1 shikimate kinase [Bacteroidales bacterium]